MEYKDSSSVIIGDADCTASGKELCNDIGVKGYPTIKYWTQEDGKEAHDYNGGRDFDGLKKFVEETLSKGCEVDNADSCDEREVKYIEKMKAKGDEAIAAQLKRLNGMKGKSMKPALKKWMAQRLNILKQLDGGKTDL